MMDNRTKRAVNGTQYYHFIKWKRFPRYWLFVRGIRLSSVDSPHKGPGATALKFPLMFSYANMNKHSNYQWFGTPWRSCDVTLYMCSFPLCHHITSTYQRVNFHCGLPESLRYRSLTTMSPQTVTLSFVWPHPEANTKHATKHSDMTKARFRSVAEHEWMRKDGSHVTSPLIGWGLAQLQIENMSRPGITSIVSVGHNWILRLV